MLIDDIDYCVGASHIFIPCKSKRMKKKRNDYLKTISANRMKIEAIKRQHQTFLLIPTISFYIWYMCVYVCATSLSLALSLLRSLFESLQMRIHKFNQFFILLFGNTVNQKKQQQHNF